jgi:hypothetical protein
LFSMMMVAGKRAEQEARQMQNTTRIALIMRKLKETRNGFISRSLCFAIGANAFRSCIWQDAIVADVLGCTPRSVYTAFIIPRFANTTVGACLESCR